jgi:hypothetical protein
MAESRRKSPKLPPQEPTQSIPFDHPDPVAPNEHFEIETPEKNWPLEKLAWYATRAEERARRFAHLEPAERFRLGKALHFAHNNVLVSYDDDPFIRRLYSGSGFRISPIQVCYRMSDGRRKQRKELLISNYDPPRLRRAGLIVGLARL